MDRGPAFTDREIFGQMLREIETARGDSYSDIRTIYGDMSRLVVAWLAREKPSKLKQLYKELSWEGEANGRALHEAARHWMRKYHSERAEKAGYGAG